jgi:aldose 1-epimerase
MSIEVSSFGRLASGVEVSRIRLDVGEASASFTDYGATWLSFIVPAGGGRHDDLLLGYSTIAGYEGSDAYFGATVGRYANRIAGARFSLDGKTYRLAANNGANHLHGGIEGFSRRVWKSEPFERGGSAGIRFELESPDGDEGYPGDLRVTATYTLGPDSRMLIEYEATCLAPTILGLTQHAYFNLKGQGRGTILDHELVLHAGRYLPVDAGLIPTGELAATAGTPFDFSSPRTVGADIAAVGGYDHCFVIDRAADDRGSLAYAGTLREPASGRSLRTETTFPGLQLYTGNYLGGIRGKDGFVYEKHSGLCLETEMFPDTPNRPAFPSCELRPGQVWRQSTAYAFTF